MMEIRQIDIKYFSSFGSHGANEGVRHIKTLPYLSVVQAVEGSYDIAIDGGATFNTGKNGAFIAPSIALQTITHHVDPTTGYMTAQWVFLTVIINGYHTLDSLFEFPVLLPTEYQEEVNEIISGLNATKDLSLSLSYVYKLVHILLKIGKPKQMEELITEKITLYVREHYREKINYKHFANALFLSKSSLFRIFATKFGKTPSAYINEYRIGIATQALENSSLSIKEIAFSVGFIDEFYFSKLFKKATGISPSEHRRIYKSNAK